ncbi:hypothetical protein CVT24_011306 [Panaeolus cyanescens]|uniref:ATP-dependent DNA helicase II subunit 2 n=1 Tax=Panaeolus cyanescens TaxID=181874 RepID=A0A409VL70_9AGAR|nr:hypothetical protein CVT24_011306 [Panaeolus cyanescens]
MAAQRGGYTVVSFIVDISPSMGKMRTVDVELPNGELKEVEMTNLQWGLHYVKLKIQEMIYNGRKTDQCNVILFGTDETNNILAPENEGFYGHVSEYIPIAQPNAGTISKLNDLEASEENWEADGSNPSLLLSTNFSSCRKALDAVVVAAEQQSRYLGKKKWTRKIVIVTDGENPINQDDWEPIVANLDNLNVGLVVVGIDFDDEEIDFAEIDKSDRKRKSEEFYHELTTAMNDGVVGTCALALEEISKPEVKPVRSALMSTVLRIGDINANPEQALELPIQFSKYTALARPKGWKKFALRVDDEDAMDVDQHKDVYAKLQQQSEYYIDPNNSAEGDDEDVKLEPEDDGRLVLDNDDEDSPREINYGRLQKVEREELVRGYKYGTTFVPAPDEFPRLATVKGMDLCGFFKRGKLRRDYVLGEVSYVWGGKEPKSQKILSSIARAMGNKDLVAIVRSVSRDGMDPKMGVLIPQNDTDVDYFTWVQVPFADDVRKYTFPSLLKLTNNAGKEVTEHPFLPTEQQMDAMDKFVDAMDLMDCGEKNEDGEREPWYSPTYAFNPALHRVKQAMFHSAVVDDVEALPPPPPHPELLTFFEPPKRAVKRSKEALEECKEVFNVKQGMFFIPKRVGRVRKDGHSHAADDGDESLLLDRQGPGLARTSTSGRMSIYEEPSASTSKVTAAANPEEDDTEEESEGELLLSKAQVKKPATPPRGPARGQFMPTPARSMSPDEVETDKAPGRIIGNDFPLKDFKKNIAQGDVVSKAVEDLGAVVSEILMRPFASKRHGEMLECLAVLRKTCLEEDEVEYWNKFLPELKTKCLSKPGNPDFWKALKAASGSQELSLISKNEAKQQGGESSIGENEAQEFLS